VITTMSAINNKSGSRTSRADSEERISNDRFKENAIVDRAAKEASPMKKEPQ